MIRYGGVEAVKGHLAMLAFSALIGGSFSFGGLIANDIAPVVSQAFRFAMAAVVLGVAALATGQLRRADLAAPWRYLMLGALMAIYFVMMFEALKTATPVSTSAVMTLMPIMTAVFSFLILRQTTTRRMVAALAVGAAGALWVIFRGDPAALMTFDVGRGEMIFFVGCIAHALYVPLTRWSNRGEAAVTTSFLVLLATTMLLFAYGWAEILATDYGALRPMVWIALGYLVLGTTAVTFVLVAYASMRLDGAKVLAYTYLTPGWVILWELAFGNGLPGAMVLPGVGLTMLALAMLLKHET